jgi:hypothetical protein
MNNVNLAQISALLRATPQTLRSEMGPLEPDILRWRPAPDKWCVNEIIGHLIDSDRRAFVGRIQTMIAQDRPVLEAWDVNVVAVSRRDVERDTFELISELEVLREDHAKLVEELTPAQLVRSAIHPRAGEFQVIDFVQEWPYHDRNHLRQILSVVQHYFWSKMGKIRDFIDPPE